MPYMKNVIIVDYQLGNLFSVKQACEHLGYHASISADPEALLKADYAIIPGVGAFADAMKNLQAFGLVDAIQQYVKTGKPLMGVCLGLQLFLTDSEEFEQAKGLNLIPGSVRKFKPEVDSDSLHLKVPQIQWNTIREPEPGVWSGSPLRNCKNDDQMYFVHSYYAQPENKDHVLSITDYGSYTYCSSVIRDNVFATQFHPEKSSLYGLKIYQDWFNQY
jgi:imidazole glycerol-phosphate synthase subunit HisH